MSEPKDRRIFLGMPGYGAISAPAARGFYKAVELPDTLTCCYRPGSLLAQNFNALWCMALNFVHAGEQIDYFAMQHADIGPEIHWLDKLINELERKDLDILGVAVPIKDGHGTTSLAIDGDDYWRPKCRLTMHELFRLPATFTSDDIGGRLLLNTGLWVCRFDPQWVKKVHFTINDRIAFDQASNNYHAEVEPEDWFFSRLCHELGLKIGATRIVRLIHQGEVPFSNTQPYGDQFDKAALSESIIPDKVNHWRFPFDVDGWLGVQEGEALAELAKGKRVVEIGSWCGRSTICLAQTANCVWAVDTFDGKGTPEPRDTRGEFRANMRRYGVQDCVVDLTDTDTIPNGGADLAFIDGAHDYEAVKADIERCLPLLAPDGLLAFHDYREKPGEFDGRWDEGVTLAVRDLVSAGAELLSTHDTLAVVRPPAAVTLEV